MKNVTLVILAAGMGSRFGGLKQVVPVGPNGEFIIDYSIYDAIKAGFNKVVFIIKEENYDLFKETIGKRVEKLVKVEYAFQSMDNVPEGYTIPEDRVKPLGTAQALLYVKDLVKEPFAIINADDFYGRNAYIDAYKFLTTECNEKKYGLIGYKIKNTLTENGSVKRGICHSNGNKLTDLIESIVEVKNGKIIATPLDGDLPFVISENQIISMNMLLFSPSIFKYIEEKFPEFLDNNKNNLDTCEFLIPDVLYRCIKDNYAQVKVINTNSLWYGVTYKEDLVNVKLAIKKLVDKGIYNNKEEIYGK